jgi:hypothetical protein
MSANTYDLGDLVRVEASFSDALLGGAIDPDVVKLSVKAPGAETVTYTYDDDATIVRDELGEFYAHIDANATGTWFYRWWSTGDGQAAIEKRFQVRGASAV